MDQNNRKQDLPYISVIVLNYNGLRHLEGCFSSLESLDYPRDRFEIIMVGNGSTDSSVLFAAQKFPRVRIVKLDKNYGFSKGNNMGAESANYPYIAFLNNDTVVHKDWLYGLAASLKQERLIVNSKMVYFHDRGILNQGRGYLYRWGIGFCKGAGEDESLFNEPVYIHHATGGSMLLRKDDFIEIGKFDEDFFAYHEDVDFGWRAWIYGYKISYTPASVGYHKTGRTMGGFSSYKTYLVARNTLSYILKNCGSKYLFSMLVMNLLFLFLLSFFFLLPFKPIPLRYGDSVKRSLAILKGIYSFAAIIPLNIKKRRKIQAKRAVSDKRLFEAGVIMSFAESVSYMMSNNFKTVKYLIEAGRQEY